MKKKIQALCASLFMGILLFMAGVQTFAEPSYTSKFSDWGNLLKQYANVEDEEETIYARGKNGVITNKEVEQAIAFYDTFGMSAEEARKQAILYVEEREALYQQAIEAGYTVTDKEVYDYFYKIIYVFLTIFLYLLKCPQSLILSALRAFCFCGKPHISRSIFLYFRYQAWLKSW